MTIAVKKPTPGDLYSFYELVSGKHILLGSNKTGSFAIPKNRIKRGVTHVYVVRVTRNGVQETIDSNRVTYKR